MKICSGRHAVKDRLKEVPHTHTVYISDFVLFLVFTYNNHTHTYIYGTMAQ